MVDNDKAYALRKEGLSLREIGERFNVTRERIRQVLLKYPKVDVDLRRLAKGRPTLPRIEAKCSLKSCQNKVVFPKSHPRKYCSMECSHKGRIKYFTDEEIRAVRQRYNKAWKDRNRVSYNKYQGEYQKEYRSRGYVRERRRIAQRNRYQRLKQEQLKLRAQSIVVDKKI